MFQSKSFWYRLRRMLFNYCWTTGKLVDGVFAWKQIELSGCNLSSNLSQHRVSVSLCYTFQVVTLAFHPLIDVLNECHVFAFEQWLAVLQVLMVYWLFIRQVCDLIGRNWLWVEVSAVNTRVSIVSAVENIGVCGGLLRRTPDPWFWHHWVIK